VDEMTSVPTMVNTVSPSKLQPVIQLSHFVKDMLACLLYHWYFICLAVRNWSFVHISSRVVQDGLCQFIKKVNS